jgi:hypothetical protein
MSLYKKFFKYLIENENAMEIPTIFGVTNKNTGKITSVLKDYSYTHKEIFRRQEDLTWRYTIPIKKLIFGVGMIPTEEQKLDILKHLTDLGYEVKRIEIQGMNKPLSKINFSSDTPDFIKKSKLGIDETVHNDFVYCGVVLDKNSHEKLLRMFEKKIPQDWAKKANHMTIDPKNPCQENMIGTPVNLMVTAFGINDKACAVKVVGYKEKTKNNFAHVTLAINELGGGRSKDSNTITEWHPIMEHITLSGTIQNIVSYNKNTAISDCIK